MKKLLVLLIALSFSLPAHAILRVGLKGGVNLANVDVSESGGVDYKMKPGFIIGPFAEVALAPGGAMALRAELLYTQKGSKIEVPNADVDWMIDELVLAPFLVYRFPVPKTTPFLEIGPEVGLNTLAKAEGGGQERNVGPGWKATNFGLNVGAGILLGLGQNDLMFDVRYNLGLSDMNDGLLNAASSTPSIKTNGIQAMVGLTFLKI